MCELSSRYTLLEAKYLPRPPQLTLRLVRDPVAILSWVLRAGAVIRDMKSEALLGSFRKSLFEEIQLSP